MSAHPNGSGPALEGMILQARRCIGLLEKIEAANGRILARGPSDPVFARLHRDGVNAACGACADRRRSGPTGDTGLDRLCEDADLKSVCDDKWVLGEEVRILRKRLDALSPVPDPYDRFEDIVRRSVVEPERTPEQLAAAVRHALDEGNAAIAWAPPTIYGETLLVRWKRRLENNPVFAAGALAAAAAATFLSLWPSGCLGGSG